MKNGRLAGFVSACLIVSVVLMGREQNAMGMAHQDAPPGERIGRPQPAETKKVPDSPKEQPKRILGIIPNYRSVSADAHLPPLSSREKFRLATEDSFDYSSFILAGLVAGEGQLQHSYPEFSQGSVGYVRYFWHSFADGAVGNYMSEFVIPSTMREDPRYYTFGHGNGLKRSGYALSRLFITRTDSAGRSFNFSEIGGNGLGAAISTIYYPAGDRTWTKVQQKWTTQVALDGVFNILKEFWPDIQQRLPKRRPHP